jgi:DNA primase
MVYSTEKTIKKDTSLKELLKEITEFDIFQYYISKKIKINQLINSPLREDKHPSFSIFKCHKTGELLYKDFANGDSGNCIKFVMKLLNLTYRQAISKVKEDVGFKLIKVSEEGERVSTYKPSTTEILVLKRNWCKHDTEYWGQYYITKEDCKEYNIYPIEKFWVNGILNDKRYESKSPMYAYFIFDKIKIYKPYTDKKDKWRTNAGTYDIQGYEQLPDKVNTLIITKALKDVIVLKKLGYYAIAPNGENHNIPESILGKLIREKKINFIIVFFDNDKTGIEAKDKLLEKHPGLYNNYILLELNSNCKDISDYVKQYGLKKAKEWLQQQLQ